MKYSRLLSSLAIAIITSGPIFICFWLLLISLNAGWLIWVHIRRGWFVLIFLLAYFGGVIVLFVYVSSLAQTQLVRIKFKTWGLLTVVCFIVDIRFIIFISEMGMRMWYADLLLVSRGAIVSFLIMHLLAVIVVVVKISKSQKGALRIRAYSYSLIEYIFYTDKELTINYWLGWSGR